MYTAGADPQFTLASDDEAALPAVAALLERERARKLAGGNASSTGPSPVLNTSGLTAVQAPLRPARAFL